MKATESIRLACITIHKQGAPEGLSLLLPHGNVITVELTSSIEDLSINDSTSTSLTARNILWPVVCFTPDLKIVHNTSSKRCSTDYRFAACINPTNPRHRFALTCDQVTSIQCNPKDLLQLPTIMHTQQSPIMGTFYHDDALYCVTDADHLAKFLQQYLDAIPRHEDSPCKLH
ncbi:hypothetical protein A9Q81_23195 [Gammaproteobacteria bacterium 42_54_T18]|nr:hypothetical protein A9Q81_23195 [Gammaproteobacteria bacterium 42_54_T18]